LTEIQNDFQLQNFVKNCYFMQKKLKKTLLLEIQNDQNSNIDVKKRISKIVFYLTCEEIDLNEIFFIFKIRNFDSEEDLNQNIMTWIRSIPISIGGILVLCFY